MKKSTVVWIIVGGLALLALGFGVGFFMNGGFGLTARPMIGTFGARRFGALPLLMGIGLLVRCLIPLGALAGIVALIIVLTRKGNSAPAQLVAAPVQPPLAPVQQAASDATAVSDATAPSNPTKPKSK